MDLVTILILIAIVVTLFGGPRLRQPMSSDIIGIIVTVLVIGLTIHLGKLFV